MIKLNKILRITFAIFAIVVNLFFMTTVHAQRSIDLELGFDYGRIVPHRSYFEPEITENSFAIDLAFSTDLNPKRYTRKLFSNTIVGGNIVYSKYGDADLFGESIGFFPFIESQKKYEKSKLYFRFGLGLAYISKKYDAVENPTNNVISANLNNVTRIEFGYKRQLKKRLGMNAAFVATHYSNGNMVRPNLGMNLIMGKLAFTYRLIEKNATQKKELINLPKSEKKLLVRMDFDYGYSTGRINGRVPGKSLFPVARANLVFAKPTGLKGQWLLGLHYEYDGSIYETLDYYQEEDKLAVAGKGMITAGYELKVGHIGMFAHLGTYFLNRGYEPISFFEHDYFYELIGLNAYMKDPNLNPHNNLYFTIRIKAHAARAQNFSVGLGWVF